MGNNNKEISKDNFRLRETCILESALNETQLIKRLHPSLADLGGLRIGMLSTKSPKTRQLLIEEALADGLGLDVLQTMAIQFSNIDLLKDLCQKKPLDWNTAKTTFLTHEERLKNKKGTAYLEREHHSFLNEQEWILKHTPSLFEYALSTENINFLKAITSSDFTSCIQSDFKFNSSVLPELVNQTGYPVLAIILSLGSEKNAEKWVEMYGWPQDAESIQAIFFTACYSFAVHNTSFKWISEALNRGAKWGETKLSKGNFNLSYFDNNRMIAFNYLENKTHPHTLEQDLVLDGLKMNEINIPKKEIESWINAWLKQNNQVGKLLWDVEISESQKGFKSAYVKIASSFRLNQESEEIQKEWVKKTLNNTMSSDTYNAEDLFLLKGFKKAYPDLINHFSLIDFYQWLKELRHDDAFNWFSWKKDFFEKFKKISEELSSNEHQDRLELIESLKKIGLSHSSTSEEQEKLFWSAPPTALRKIKKTL